MNVKMTKIRWAIIVGTWFVVVSCPFLCVNSKRQQLPAVRTDLVTRADVAAYVSGPATVKPRVSVDISANIAGRVTKIYVKEGQRVKKGDLLLELEKTQYQAGRDEAFAAYRAALRNLELAESKWATAQDIFNRKRELFNKKLISPEQFDLARTQYEAERTEYEVARENVTRARAALTQARDTLAKTTYTSPIDGVVTALNVEEGEFTVVGTLNTPGTVMLTVADLAAMEVTAEIDETDVVNVRVGQPAFVTVDAFPDVVFRGEVIEVGSSAIERLSTTTGEETSADFEVKVLLAGDTKGLRPGMHATADIVTGRAANVVVVPIQALVTRSRADLATPSLKNRREKHTPKDEVESGPPGAKDFVKGVYLWVDEKPLVKKARFVPVETGLVGDRFVEIKRGLKGGEEIIVGPYNVLRKLRDGDIVRREPEKRFKEETEEKTK